jgi:hypothetical protein
LVDDSGTLVGLGPHGEDLFTEKSAMAGYFSHFSTLVWPGICPSECLLVSRSGNLLVLTIDRKRIVAELGAPYAEYLALKRK